jgi:GTP-binding protein EngB required for normal cell division
MAASDEYDSNSIKKLFHQLAEENGIADEQSIESVAVKYLKDQENMPVLRKQILSKACINRILVIGDVGVGKSSTINLLMNNKKAEVTNKVSGCTFKCEVYQVVFEDEFYEIVDTMGLNEASKGSVPPKEALKELIGFIKKSKRGFSCVLFIMKQGPLDKTFEENHTLFYKSLFQKIVPTILFINYCEQDDPMDKWIKKAENFSALQPYGFGKIVCGTGKEVSGRLANILTELRKETFNHLWEAIKQNISKKPVSIEPDLNLFQRIWNTCFTYFHINNLKFMSRQYANFLEYLKEEMRIDDATIQNIRNILV